MYPVIPGGAATQEIPSWIKALKLAESTLHHQSWALKKPWKNFTLDIPL